MYMRVNTDAFRLTPGHVHDKVGHLGTQPRESHQLLGTGRNLPTVLLLNDLDKGFQVTRLSTGKAHLHEKGTGGVGV
jgi:hypothetical protein